MLVGRGHVLSAAGALLLVAASCGGDVTNEGTGGQGTSTGTGTGSGTDRHWGSGRATPYRYTPGPYFIIQPS